MAHTHTLKTIFFITQTHIKRASDRISDSPLKAVLRTYYPLRRTGKNHDNRQTWVKYFLKIFEIKTRRPAKNVFLRNVRIL